MGGLLSNPPSTGQTTGFDTAVILQQFNQLKNQNCTLETELQVFKATVIDLLGKLHRSMTRVTNSPFMFSRQENAEQAINNLNILNMGLDSNARLSPTPRSLHTLWLEYQQGIGGRKAAKLFTPEERGRVKHKYCMRKPFWDLVARMVQNGYTAHVAIDKIYKTYGRLGSLTNILREIKKERGNHSLILV